MSGPPPQPAAAAPAKLPPEASASARRRHWLGLALAGLVLIALVFWLDLGEIAAVLGRLHPAALAGIVALLLLDRVVMAWKWLLLLRAGGIDLPLGRAVRWYLQGTLSGAFLPSMMGGDLLRGYWAARASGQAPFVFASLVMEKMLGFLSAIHWGILGGVVFACWRLPEASWLWIGLGVCAALAVTALFILSLHPRVHGVILGALDRFRGRKLIGVLHKLYQAYTHFSSVRGALARNYLITVGEQLLQLLIFLAIALALGIAVDPVLFLAATTLHTVVLRIPISPEGWGVGELSAIGFYGLIGIGAEAAFAIMFIFHVVVLIACAPGFVFLLRGEEPVRTAPAPHS